MKSIYYVQSVILKYQNISMLLLKLHSMTLLASEDFHRIFFLQERSMVTRNFKPNFSDLVFLRIKQCKKRM